MQKRKRAVRTIGEKSMVAVARCPRGLLAGLAVVLIVPSIALAVSPELGVIIPRAVQRGVESDINFHGNRLEDVQQVIFYEPGIEVLELKAVSTNHVTAKIRTAPDVVPGTRHVRLRTSTGMTEMRNLAIAAYPVVTEVEPNSEFATPQAVALGTTVTGVIENEDVDYFVVDARAGDRITAEIQGIRMGDAFCDAYVAILNSARFELATSDDAALVFIDGIASVVAPADGKYIIQLRESSYAGGGGHRYVCHIGSYPRPKGLLPAGGPAGQTVGVQFLGDVAGEFSKEFALPPAADRLFGIVAEDARGIAPAPYKFRVSQLQNSIEQEPNDSAEVATRMTVPGAANGVLGAKADYDLFRFTATKGQTFDFNVYGRRLRSELDSVLYVMNLQGGVLAGNDDQGGLDSQLRFTIPEDGDYLINVRDQLGNSGPGYFYRVEVTAVAPELTLTVNEFVQFVEQRLVVRQGDRLPLLVSANRKDFGGLIQFAAENFPPGVSLETPGLIADDAVAQVVIAADATAPLGMALSQIRGTAADGNGQPITSAAVTQDGVLVRGQNNIPFWTEPLPAMAITVAEKVPYAVEIVQPKVPLVHGGAMRLKVVARRNEGFTAPIKVELLANPSGVNSARNVAIAEGQTEAFIDLNAAGNARVGEWPITLRAEAAVGNGTVVTGSPFAKLAVAESYLKFDYQAAAVEKGQETDLVVNVEALKPFPGNAQVVLYGLPHNVTTSPATITSESKEIIFRVKSQPDSPAGQNKNLFCQVVITEHEEPIVHNIGTGQIRIDEPLPPKTMPVPVAEAPPQAAPTPVPEQQPAPKRLTRLEQLRLEQKQRVEAQGGK